MRYPLLLVLLLGAACASSRTVETPGAVPAAAPQGRWMVTITSADLGELRVPMRFEEQRRGRFRAYSRPGALSTIIGGGRAVLARLVGGSEFDRGSLLHVDDGISESIGGETRLRGSFNAPMLGRSDFGGRLMDGRISGELRRATSGALWATLDAVPTAETGPVRDYAAVFAQVEDALRTRLHDPRLLETQRWSTFLSTMGRRLPEARDDAEAIMHFFLAMQPLELSHFALLGDRFGDIELPAPARDDTARATEPDPVVHLTFPESGIARLAIRHFLGTPEPIRIAFAVIDSAAPNALIIDLRGNPGGNFSSMSVAAHLLGAPAAAGFFVGSTWWRSHSALPTTAQIQGLPVLSSYDLDAFFRAMREHGALAGRVTPVAPHYRGRVYVLIDNRTASAAEPLAELLATTGRATLIGQPTAGAMLSSERIPLEAGLVLMLPTGDYYTAQGRRLEGAGVDPHVLVPSAEALDTALRLAAAPSSESE